MKNKGGFAPIIILLIVAALAIAGGTYYLGKKSNNGSTAKNEIVATSTAGQVVSFNIVPSTKDGQSTMYKTGAKAVLTAKNIQSAEVWGLPTGTGMTEGFSEGKMVKVAESSSGDTWEVVLPKYILATDVWVEAKDLSGITLKSVGLGSVAYEEGAADTKPLTSGWKTYNDAGIGVSVSYPASWTYQKFTCNEAGVAFCPLAGHASLNCSQSCAPNSPESPIYLYTTGVGNGAKPSLVQWDKSGEYGEIFSKMLSTFSFVSASSSVAADSGKNMGYIKSLYVQNGKYYLAIDYATWLTGKPAVQAALEDGRCSIEGLTIAQALERLKTENFDAGLGDFGACAPNGYYIQNSNPKIRIFEIAPGVKINMKTWGGFAPKVITLETLYGIFSGTIAKDPMGEIPASVWKELPYWITLDGGIINEIDEQYLP